MTVGERIKIKRKELGITQGNLAQKLGYKSRSSINKIELGQQQVSQHTLILIAQILQTTPDYLLGYTQDKDVTHADFIRKLNSYEINRIVNVFNNATEADKDKFFDLLKNLMEQSNDDKDAFFEISKRVLRATCEDKKIILDIVKIPFFTNREKKLQKEEEEQQQT